MYSICMHMYEDWIDPSMVFFPKDAEQMPPCLVPLYLGRCPLADAIRGTDLQRIAPDVWSTGTSRIYPTLTDLIKEEWNFHLWVRFSHARVSQIGYYTSKKISYTLYLLFSEPAMGKGGPSHTLVSLADSKKGRKTSLEEAQLTLYAA
ncbi:hypothetical protein HDV62DRAFT_41181 [Trichoderma sp. SZMC 28011]